MTAIFTFATWLAVVFFVPETRFARDFSASLETTNAVASSPTFSPSSEETPVPSDIDEEKHVYTSTTEPHSPPHTTWNQVPKKSYLQSLTLWTGVPRDVNLFELFIRPFPLILYPSIMFAFLGYAVTLAWVISINVLNPFVLQAPPYNMSPSINGLINIPGFLGNMIGAFAGGWCVDRYCDWSARREGGVFKPEMRLVLLIFPLVVVPAGCVLFGYGVQDTMPWIAIFFGFGMVSLGLTAVSSGPLPSRFPSCFLRNK